MSLDDRVKQIEANQGKKSGKYNMEDLANEICSKAYELKCKNRHPSKGQIGSLFYLLIVYTNLAGLTLEECLCYSVDTIGPKGQSRTTCHECGNPNCFDDGK